MLLIFTYVCMSACACVLVPAEARSSSSFSGAEMNEPCELLFVDRETAQGLSLAVPELTRLKRLALNSRDLSASASSMLGLKACAPTTGHDFLSFKPVFPQPLDRWTSEYLNVMCEINVNIDAK